MGHDKGNKAELEVAKLVQPWWQQLDPGALFVRTPRSGGWMAGRDLFGARGDLMCKDAPRFPWCVEVKRREAWSLENLEEGKQSPVWKWWRQACNDATAAKLLPMLWTRHNRGEWLVLLPSLRPRRAPEPDLTWEAIEHFVELIPVAYWADKLLDSHPSKWVVR